MLDLCLDSGDGDCSGPQQPYLCCRGQDRRDPSPNALGPKPSFCREGPAVGARDRLGTRVRRPQCSRRPGRAQPRCPKRSPEVSASLPVPSPLGRSSASHLAGIRTGLHGSLLKASRRGVPWPCRTFWGPFGTLPASTPSSGRGARRPLPPSMAAGATTPPPIPRTEPGLEGTSKSGAASRGCAGTFFGVPGS